MTIFRDILELWFPMIAILHLCISPDTCTALFLCFITYLTFVEFIPVLVGPCHHGMARPQVVDRGTASDKEGSCE